MSNLRKQFTNIESMHKKQGRPRATTANEDLISTLKHGESRTETASQFCHELYETPESRVSRITVCRRLFDKGLFAMTPDARIFLIFTIRRTRLIRCGNHRL